MKADAAESFQDDRSSARRHNRALAVLAPLALIAGVAGIVGGSASSLSERAMSGTWHRAVVSDPGIIHVLGDGDAIGSALHPASTGDAGRAPVIGERVTLVAPDGTIRSLRVCDPASPSSVSAPDCLNAYLSRAVPPSHLDVRQRSL